MDAMMLRRVCMSKIKLEIKLVNYLILERYYETLKAFYAGHSDVDLRSFDYIMW